MQSDRPAAILRFLSVLGLGLACAAGSAASLRAATGPDDFGPTLDALERAAGGQVDVTRSRRTGFATFVRIRGGVAAPTGLAAAAAAAAGTPEARALGFLQAYGRLFGLKDASQLVATRTSPRDSVGMDHVRFQQVHGAVPVTGAELVVHLKGSRVIAVNGKARAADRLGPAPQPPQPTVRSGSAHARPGGVTLPAMRVFLELIHGHGAHVDATACVTVSLDLAGRIPEGLPHSLSQLVGHMTYWMEYELARIGGKAPQYPERAALSWPTEARPESEESWRDAIGRFAACLQGMEKLVQAGPEALRRPVPLTDPVHSRQAESVEALLWQTVVHNSYHLGQVAQVRRALGAWPPEGGGDTW